MKGLRRGLGLLLAASALSVGACGDGSLTEIVVVVDTDIADVDGVDLAIVEPGGASHSATAALSRGAPASFGIVHRGGPLGPLRVTARARRAAISVPPARVASVSFREGRVMVLRMDLLAACAATTCGPSQTCVEGAECVGPEWHDDRLTPWRGGVDRLDGAVDDGGMPGDGAIDGGVSPDGGDGGLDAGCTPSGEVDSDCDGVDDDCNGVADDRVAFDSDPMHCGACDVSCGGAACDARVCVNAPADVAVGGNHACVVRAGAVLCWGANNHGQLGNGTMTEATTATPITVTSETFVGVSAGSDHTCAWTSGGLLYCWGDNAYGQLGDGTKMDRTMPTLVPSLPSVRDASAGSNHTCAAQMDGQVFCWGRSLNQRLGFASMDDVPSPTLVGGVTGVSQVEAGQGHTCALTTSGVVCWGENGSHQVASGVTSNRSPTPVALGGTVRRLIAGNDHSCVITTTREMQCWGANNAGQLGNGTVAGGESPAPVLGVDGAARPLADVVWAHAGATHTCAIVADGRAFCWGDNGSGQLGIGMDVTRRLLPTRVADRADFVRIGGGGTATCALDAHGGRWCWGNGAQTAVGRTPRPVPIL